MSRFSRFHFRVIFLLITLAVLAIRTRFAPASIGLSWLGMLAAASLVTFCDFFPLILPSNVEISLVHIVGLSLLFTFGPTPAMWAVTIGLVASKIIGARGRPTTWRARLETLATELSQQALSLLVASGLYAWLGGGFPITAITRDTAAALIALGGVYLVFYNVFLALRFEPGSEAVKSLFTSDFSQLVALELVPIPLTIYASAGFHALGANLLLVLGGVLAVIDASLHSLTRAQARLRRQMLENLRLYRESQARLREQSILYETGQTLTSTLERRAVYNAIAQKLAEVISADECVLLDYDEGAALMQTAAQWTRTGGAARNAAQSYPLEGYPGIARLLSERAPLIVRADAPDPAPQADGRLLSGGFNTVLILPMATSEQVVGLVELYSVEAREFSEAEVRLAQTLANQAAIAIANAQLFYRVSEGRDRLIAVLNSTREGVLVLEASGAVLLANPRIEEIWGIPAERLIGQDLLHLLTLPDLDIAAKLGLPPEEILEMLHTLKMGLAMSIPKAQYQINAPKRRFLERSGAPVLDRYSKAIGWVITLRDATEEREVQEVRQALSNMIVHDLRSPLTAVQASMALLRTQVPASPVATQALEVAGRSTKRMIRMVNTLLDISRIESGTFNLERNAVDLQALVNEVIADLMPIANEQGIFLINEMPAFDPAAVVDKEKVERVFMNLVDNALKFTPAGGRIRVRGDWADAGQTAASAKMIRCAVIDTGPGIPADYREKVFDRFVQVRGQTGRRAGTGLGLSFCKLVAEAHGGKIWVESLPEGGSAFYFTLPAGGADTQPI